MISISAFVLCSSLLLAFSRTAASERSAAPVGCFRDNGNATALHNEVPGAGATVDDCVRACTGAYYPFALLWNASACYCGSSYMDYADGTCDKACAGNVTQMCGGEESYSVYDTGQHLPGPPHGLRLLNVSESTLQIQWEHPSVPNGPLTNYSITAKPVSTYLSSPSLAPYQNWLYPNTTFKTEILDLHPGTCYNVSVAGVSSKGTGAADSDRFCTEIGVPSVPPTPEVIASSGRQMTVRLMPAVNDNGPVSAYRVVVIFDEGLASFRPESLHSYNVSREEGLSFYIAAELPNDWLSGDKVNTFIVGDGRKYGQYYNAPLPMNAHIHVSLGVVSTLNGITKVNYAETSHKQDGIVILNVGNNMVIEQSSGLEVGLSAAVGVCATLLVFSVVIFLILRSRVKRRARHGSEHQELSLEGPIFEVESSGYNHNSFVPEETEERVDHYKKLKEQVWNVPRNFLDIQNYTLGTGRYGNVLKGTVQQRGYPIPVAVHVIPDSEMIPAEKHAMLKDLGMLIRGSSGDIPNVVQLVGISETPETLYVMVEQHPASLKDMLLESRSLAHASGHDSRHSLQRVCSLPERQLLEAILGIARAMDYLSQQNIIHKQIAARNVLMAHGVVPKLTAFGIAQFTRGNEMPDYTRWTAQEIFRSGRYITKSDVWSFGCFMWEVAALGATPYADVSTVEVGPRVMRGLRLPQLQLLSDDLYQLMLQCWQVDLDERPSFQELAHVLENLLDDSAIHLNFSVYVGFHYEQYVPELERQ